MAQAGDTYTIKLTESMLGWGNYRYTDTRDIIYGEAYIAIPQNYAHQFHLYNGNHTNNRNILGENVFNCTSGDGSLNCLIKSQGCNQAGSEYAKQFSVANDLRALGTWFRQIGANVGDLITITFTSPTDMVITH